MPSEPSFEIVVQLVSPQDMKLFCQVREALRHYNIPCDFSVLMDALRGAYIERVGLRHYLGDQLGPHAGGPARDWVVYGVEGQKIVRLAASEAVRLIDYLAAFGPDALPHRVECRRNRKISLAL